MSGFDTRWLDLREKADHAARDTGLLEKAIAHADAGGQTVSVVDLGCGTVRRSGHSCRLQHDGNGTLSTTTHGFSPKPQAAMMAK